MKRFMKWLLPRPSRTTASTVRKSSNRLRMGIEALEDRQVLSTLFVNSFGLLTYAANTGVANQLSISLDQATDIYRFTDKEAINAPGFIGNGTTSVLVPNARVAAMQILLVDGDDTLSV